MSTPRKFRMAHYGGVQFHFDSSTDSSSRRIVTHQYPNREDHTNEDLGKSAGKFSVSGYIVGEDLDAQERALKEAFLREGVFTFYHPKLNANIECRALDSAFSPDKDSLLRRNFTVNFVEEGEPPAPISLNRAKPAVINLAKNAKKTLQDYFDQVFDPLNNAAKAINDVNSALNEVKSSFYANYVDALSSITAPINALEDLADNIVSTVDISPYTDLVDSLFDSYKGEELKRNTALNSISGISVERSLSNSIASTKSNVNSVAIENVIRQYALVKLAESIVQTEYADSDASHAARNNYVSLVLEQQENLSEQDNGLDFYNQIGTLASFVGERLAYLSDTLKPVSKIENNQRSALTLAWDLYKNPELAEDLIIRNSVDNGSFMPNTVTHLAQ